jgi:hypothetical protein
MTIQSRINELHDNFDAFLARPSPGALIVGCTDHEVLHLAHVLGQLDTESPADQFFIAVEPFTTPREYVDTVIVQISAALQRTIPSSADPVHDLRNTLHILLTDLPAGDHRLVFALIPAIIDDPSGFTAIIEPLLSDPAAALRIIIRDTIDAPNLLLSAEASPSDQHLAYRFRLPPDLVLDDLHHAACDPARTPEERAQALVQLAVQELGHGRHTAVIAACDMVLQLAPSPETSAFALALRADAMRAVGRLHHALASACTALAQAVACQAAPIVHHAAMTLGELSAELGNIEDAVRCFTIAEHAAPHSEEARATACAHRLALTDSSC